MMSDTTTGNANIPDFCTSQDHEGSKTAYFAVIMTPCHPLCEMMKSRRTPIVFSRPNAIVPLGPLLLDLIDLNLQFLDLLLV